MHCAKALQIACLRLPQRIKPHLTGRISVFLANPSVRFKFSKTIFCSSYFPCSKVPFFYRAKNQFFLGLLALLFCRFVFNNLIEEII